MPLSSFIDSALLSVHRSVSIAARGKSSDEVHIAQPQRDARVRAITDVWRTRNATGANERYERQHAESVYNAAAAAAAAFRWNGESQLRLVSMIGGLIAGFCSET